MDCHQRLRQVTALAAQLPGATAEAVCDVAAKVQRYFSVALPLHEQDEEFSLFPRLLKAAPELASIVAALRADHDALASQVARLLELCRQVQQSPRRADALATALAEAARALQEGWQHHLTAEEQHVFPAVRGALSEQARAEIRQEMRERRSRLP